MAETAEKEKSGLGEFFDKIKNDLSSLWDKIKEGINDLIGKEIFEVTSKTQKELNTLADEVLKLNELSDEKINDNEKKIFDKLMGKEKIKKFFEWLNDDSIGDDLLVTEKQKLLQIVKDVSNNDSNNKKSDLTETEMNTIVGNYESKLNILNSVLDDENIKNKDPKVTKKQVLESYNKLQKDGKTVTKQLIIDDLNNKNNK